MQPKVNPWESQIFYQIFPRSYRDSNGDRTGDFKGIQQGIPTIKKLGCTAILLNPVQKSRFYHNYFADDFRDVDPSFGSLQDFEDLIKAAHQAGLKIVLDMEPQYVSNLHPWYVGAMNNPSGPVASYLSETPNPKSGFANWYKHDTAQVVPVNLLRPEVVQDLKDVFRLWSSRGVDGYRIDHMMDDLDFNGKSKGLYAGLWTPIENEIKRQFPGTFFVGEQADWEAYRSSVEMFDETPTDACFNFRLRNAFMSFKKGILLKSLDEYKWFTREGRFQLTFLENHDMIRFASVESNPKKQKLAAALMALVKGAPIVYYGQELGMKGEQGHFGSDGNDVPVRLAYRWGRMLDAGGTALWYKGTGPWWNDRFSRDRDGISLEEEEHDPASLFNWYVKVLHVRLSNPALLSGTQELVDIPSDTILGIRRTKGNQSVLVLVNLCETTVVVPRGPFRGGRDLLTGRALSPKKRVRLLPWQVVALDEPQKEPLK